ncbi:cyclase family protein [Aliiglaciecola sp. 3_MG-2023]|uniref:cyclase family protein n=1 Tax=Aliiglaciecola sp. 3_MG-2023 TaxID=3062644 RepID=UPI0026E2A23B|nr:cyclase family protein [Aliiglaciecola sp. 3_MG-2023]MDO6694810.1 cyclase family protein [Aliiglaciecola sp. 3_MG-2023]
MTHIARKTSLTKTLSALVVGISFTCASLTSFAAEETYIDKLLADAPKNWGKWGKDDQIGALNYLDETQVKRGVKAIQSGERFTLQLPMIHGVGPVFPGRVPVMHFMAQDEGIYSSNKSEPLVGGMKYSDDAVFMYLQGTTHMDALGHAWYSDKVYNGKSSDTTVHGHDYVDIAHLGDVGVAGRGVLIDVGRFSGDKNHRLAPGTCVTLADIKNTAKKQKLTIEKRDILMIRTGSMGRFYDEDDKQNWTALDEPGLCYSPELVQWIADMEIPVIAADNLAVELAAQKVNGNDMVIPLHGALIRNLGVVLTELYWLDDLAADSAEDGQYSFFFSVAPLKMKGGTGSPVNPMVIK